MRTSNGSIAGLVHVLCARPACFPAVSGSASRNLLVRRWSKVKQRAALQDELFISYRISSAGDVHYVTLTRGKFRFVIVR